MFSTSEIYGLKVKRRKDTSNNSILSRDLGSCVFQNAFPNEINQSQNVIKKNPPKYSIQNEEYSSTLYKSQMNYKNSFTQDRTNLYTDRQSY